MADIAKILIDTNHLLTHRHTKSPRQRTCHLTTATLLACSLLLLAQITLVISSSAASDAITSSSKKSTSGLSSSPVAEAAAASIESAVVSAKSSSTQPQPQQPAESSSAPASDLSLQQPKSSAAADVSADKTGERKARADAGAAKSSASDSAASDSKPATASAPPDASAKIPESNATASAAPKSSAPSKKQQQQHLSGKSGSGGKSKLPANLGTVTSTGSGGPAHYLSKHDAYSAIAEKHGSLTQMTAAHHKKADSRRNSNSMQRFGGIQKASGLGDMLSPFKGVTDSGLARTLGASMRSIMKSKYSVPAYIASALLGAVTLMAFYESPMSPLPVPSLPEPPVGRFPPEMPNISPNVIVPYRTSAGPNGGGNGQGQYYGQNYNQRSLQTQSNGQMAPQVGTNNNLQQQQQVYFPSSSPQSAQQRQMNAPAQQSSASGGSTGFIGGQVQQMASNLLSVGKQQAAQRKSGSDYDPTTMARSFLSAMAGGAGNVNGNGHPFEFGKLSGSSNLKNPSSSATNSFLSYFGFGGGSGASSAQSQSASAAGNSPSQSPASPISDGLGYSSNGAAAAGAPSPLDSKAQLLPSSSATVSSASPLSGSHLVNKVKSMFGRGPVAAAAGGSTSSSNMYDQYARMTLVQALMKDTAFLPAFLSPTRKSSVGSSLSSSSSSSPIAAASKLQSLANAISSVASQSSSNSMNSPAARMQVDGPILTNVLGGQQAASGNSAQNKQRATSGHGLMRAADRLAHVLLETFTSGFMQRSAPAVAADSQKVHLSQPAAERKSSDGSGPMDSVSSQQALGDMVSSYNQQLGAAIESMQAKSAQQQPQQQQSSASSGDKRSSATNQHQAASPSGRSEESASTASSSSLSSSPSSAAVAAAAPSASDHKQQEAATSQQSPSTPDLSAPSSSGALSRKTRSVGFEYPMESDQMIALKESLGQMQQQRQQQYQQQPSRAAQINNFVDFVSDSYSQNKMLVNFLMNHVGLGNAVPYVEQILASSASSEHQQ